MQNSMEFLSSTSPDYFYYLSPLPLFGMLPSPISEYPAVTASPINSEYSMVMPSLSPVAPDEYTNSYFPTPPVTELTSVVPDKYTNNYFPTPPITELTPPPLDHFFWDFMPMSSLPLSPPLTTTTTTTTTTNDTISSHQMISKHFSCEICQRPFSRKYDLRRHFRIHTGDKPYSCPCCKKAFARTDALKRHLRVEEKCRKSPQVQSMKRAGKRCFKNL